MVYTTTYEQYLYARWLEYLTEVIANRVKEWIEMAILTFENIIEADDITETEVPVPEWGGSVVVRSISYRKMGRLKKKVAEAKGDVEISDDDSEYEKELLVAGLVNPTIDIDQAELLMDKSAGAVMKVLSAVMKTSKEEKDSVKDAEKSVPAESE